MATTLLDSTTPIPRYVSDDFLKLSIPTGASNLTMPTAGTLTLTPPGLLYIGSAGTLVLNLMDGSAGVTFSSVAIGFLPVYVTGIVSSGTTAANIVCCY